MAERIAQKLAKEDHVECNFSSAGLFVNDLVIEDKTKQALQILGYDDKNVASVQLEKTLPNVLYVAVTDAHKNFLKAKRVISFKDLAGEVSDPYGKPLEAYIETAKQIEQNVKVLLQKMKDIRSKL